MAIAEHPPGRGPNIDLLLGYVSETFHLFIHRHPQFVSLASYRMNSSIKSPRAKFARASESALTRVNESETVTLKQV
jgi:hypothetical protein